MFLRLFLFFQYLPVLVHLETAQCLIAIPHLVYVFPPTLVYPVPARDARGGLYCPFL